MIQRKYSSYDKFERIHETFALAMQVLHFEKFLSTQEDSLHLIEELDHAIHQLHQLQTVTEIEFSLSKEVKEILEKYRSFCENTSLGKM